MHPKTKHVVAEREKLLLPITLGSPNVYKHRSSLGGCIQRSVRHESLIAKEGRRNNEREREKERIYGYRRSKRRRRVSNFVYMIRSISSTAWQLS